MEGFLDMTQLIKNSSLDWSSLDSYIQESSTYGGQIWSLPWTFDLGTIAALSCHAAATWLTDVIILHTGATDTLFFRKDILDRHGLSPPATWRDLLELAERFNGTNTETGEGEGDLFGTCFYWQNAACASPTYATAREWSAHGRGGGEGLTRTATTTTADLFDIAAPMLQARGTASGTIFAPDGIELYLDSVAMIKAYEIYRWVPTMPCRGQVD